MNYDANRMMQFEARKKSAGVAYLLWFFIGMLGVHRFYLGRTGSGIAILLLTIISAFLIPTGIGLVTIAIPGLWVLIDLFLIPGMARSYNLDLINRV